MSQHDPLPLPDPFRVRVRWEPGNVHDPFGEYAEACWTPGVGPTAYLLARRMLLEPGTWDKALLAASVGVGHMGGRNSPLERSLIRLVRFHLAKVEDGDLVVFKPWPAVPRAMLRRLHPDLVRREAEMRQHEIAAAVGVAG